MRDEEVVLDYSVECALDDGTGVVWLIFPGKREVPGVEIGTMLGAEGVVQERDGQLVIEDPFYRLENGSQGEDRSG